MYAVSLCHHSALSKDRPSRKVQTLFLVASVQSSAISTVATSTAEARPAGCMVGAQPGVAAQRAASAGRMQRTGGAERQAGPGRPALQVSMPTHGSVACQQGLTRHDLDLDHHLQRPACDCQSASSQQQQDGEELAQGAASAQHAKLQRIVGEPAAAVVPPRHQPAAPSRAGAGMWAALRQPCEGPVPQPCSCSRGSCQRSGKPRCCPLPTSSPAEAPRSTGRRTGATASSCCAA
jgi:hypothetical protein